MKNIIAGTRSIVGPSGPNPRAEVVYPAFAAAAFVELYALLAPNSLCASRLNELTKLACELTSSRTTTTANPIMPPTKHHFWTFAYPDIPSDTRVPASAIVISVTMKIPFLVPPQPAPPPCQVMPTVAHSGWNSADTQGERTPGPGRCRRGSNLTAFAPSLAAYCKAA